MSDWKLLNTSTASGASSVEFTDLTGYKIFKFVFIDVNPATDAAEFQFDCSVSGTYGTTKTTMGFESYHNEADSQAGIGTFNSIQRLAQSTGEQMLMVNLGNGVDECGAGELFLFNPSSTTYVKHFYSRSQYYHESDYSYDNPTSGYINTTSALDGVKFSMSSGNLDAVIKQYGLVAT